MSKMTAKILEFSPGQHSFASSTSQTHINFPEKEDSTGGELKERLNVKKLQDMLKSLNEVFRESRMLDGGVGGEECISESAYYNATRLLAVLPVDLPMPEILADPDGYVEFEWSKDGKNFSLYATDTNVVLFAGFYGKEDRLSGRFNFEADLPSRPVRLAKDVFQEDSF